MVANTGECVCVCGAVMRYLRGDVVRCSTEGLGGDAVKHIFFTHAKVCDLNVALTVQHDVVQLQVSKNRTERTDITAVVHGLHSAG